MSGVIEFDDDNDPSLLAGEYVLGALDPEEMGVVFARSLSDEGLAADIRGWEALLGPLAALSLPVAPPAELWLRIARSIGARPPVVEAPVELIADAPVTPEMRSIRRWRIATGASLALAAALAGVIVIPDQPLPLAFASLTPMGPDSAAAFIVRIKDTDKLQITALTPRSVPAGHDLELWLLAPNAPRPVSLGLLTSQGPTVKTSKLVAGGGKLLVSLEPKGGSPTGLPTGPVLYGGLITTL